MSADLDMEAAEYVLGTLDAGERSLFADRLRTDSEAASAVAAWERRLAGLAERGDQVAPGPHVWTELEQLIRLPAAKPLPFRVIDGGRVPAPPALSYKDSRNRWRLGALVSGAIAAGLVVFVANREMSAASSPSVDITYIAAVNRGGDKPALLIRVDLRTREVFVRPVAAEAPAGKSLELWYIGDHKAPRPMGLIDKTPARLPIPRGATAIDAAFAVSVEPPGGSTTGGPTGPVVYSGQLVKASD